MRGFDWSSEGLLRQQLSIYLHGLDYSMNTNASILLRIHNLLLLHNPPLSGTFSQIMDAIANDYLRKCASRMACYLGAGTKWKRPDNGPFDWEPGNGGLSGHWSEAEVP